MCLLSTQCVPVCPRWHATRPAGTVQSCLCAATTNPRSRRVVRAPQGTSCARRSDRVLQWAEPLEPLEPRGARTPRTARRSPHKVKGLLSCRLTCSVGYISSGQSDLVTEARAARVLRWRHCGDRHALGSRDWCPLSPHVILTCRRRVRCSTRHGEDALTEVSSGLFCLWAGHALDDGRRGRTKGLWPVTVTPTVHRGNKQTSYRCQLSVSVTLTLANVLSV